MDVYRWFRWHHGSVSDPKMRMVAAKAETSVANVVAVWAALLEAASENADRGCIGEFDDDLCAFTLGIDVPLLMRVKLAMRDRGMLIDDRVSAWDKRQPRREDETARDRKARERERKAANSVTATCHAVSRDVTQQDASSQNVPPRGEEIREEKTLSPKPPSKPRSRRVFVDSPEFAAFWEAYPQKQDKGAARKAWDGAIGRVSVADIMAGLERAKAVWRAKGTEAQFIPYPHRWLGNERWTDEPATTPTTPQPRTSGYGAFV